MKMRGGIFSGRVLQEKLEKKANEESKRAAIVAIVESDNKNKKEQDKQSAF